MSRLAVVLFLSLFSFAALGHDVDDLSVLTPLGSMANFTSKHFGYTLALTPEEESQRALRCMLETLPEGFHAYASQRTSCSGVTSDPRIIVRIGWKQTDYRNLALATDLGNGIVNMNKMGPGNFYCQEDPAFKRKIAGARMMVTDCRLVIGDSLPFWYSIAFFAPNKKTGTTQWIAVISEKDPSGRDQEVVKQELQFLLAHVR